MKVAKLTLWDGSLYYTNNKDPDYMSDFFARAYAKLMEDKDFKPIRLAQVDIIDMTEEDYQAIPTTQESMELFGI